MSAGLRKTAAEEKQPQQKQEDSDDSDGDGPSAHPPPRGAAPKKLQMVNDAYVCSITIIVYSATVLCQNDLYFSFSRVISGGTSPRDLQVAFSLVKDLVAGRNTLKALDRNFCRKWATNRAKAWARMHKVGCTYQNIGLRDLYEYSGVCT